MKIYMFVTLIDMVEAIIHLSTYTNSYKLSSKCTTKTIELKYEIHILIR